LLAVIDDVDARIDLLADDVAPRRIRRFIDLRRGNGLAARAANVKLPKMVRARKAPRVGDQYSTI
jgi:hypothetical protein